MAHSYWFRTSFEDSLPLNIPDGMYPGETMLSRLNRTEGSDLREKLLHMQQDTHWLVSLSARRRPQTASGTELFTS
jgi:hypothetical protein